MFGISGIDEAKCIDIFLSTLPYDNLIEPFKNDVKLQKKLAGFRLIESACPPKKIIPILREEIIKGKLSIKKFTDEWIKIHSDIALNIKSFEIEQIRDKLKWLCDLYTPEMVISTLLVEGKDGTGDIIGQAIEIKEMEDKNIVDDIKKIEGDEEKRLSKINKKLEKEIERLQEKLIKEEKKNIIEIESLMDKINRQNNEIIMLNKQISDLKKEKENLELRLERIGSEFEKRMVKIVENSISRERNAENLKSSINKLLMDIKQDNVEFKNRFFEIKDILQDLSQKINSLLSSNATEQAAVSLEEYKDYSLLDDLSEMLKNK